MSRVVAYFDASALAKRYSRERGTELVNEIFRLLPSSARACSVIELGYTLRSLSGREVGGRMIVQSTRGVTWAVRRVIR